MKNNKTKQKIRKGTKTTLFVALILFAVTRLAFVRVDADGGAPIITKISPNSGLMSGGSEVTVTGEGFITDGDFNALATGDSHAFAIVSGQLYGWGLNNVGQIGVSTNVGGMVSTSPANLMNGIDGPFAGKSATLVTAGRSHTLAVVDGELYSWGSNEYGQLGNGNNYDYYRAHPVNLSSAGMPFEGKTVTNIIAKGDFSVAVADGEIYTWGRNDHGQLGNGSFGYMPNSSPMSLSESGKIFEGKTIELVAAGVDHMLVVADGALYAWGANSAGQLGSGAASGSVLVPVDVSSMLPFDAGDIEEVIAGDYYSAAIVAGELFTWGSNSSGQLGSGTNIDSPAPINLCGTGMPFEGGSVTMVVAGYAHTMALVDGDLYSWGRNTFGQLGSGDNTDVLHPVNLSDIGMPFEDGSVAMVDAGSEYSLAVVDGGMFGWGYNEYGQVGESENPQLQFLTPESVNRKMLSVQTIISVEFGDVAASIITVDSETMMRVKVPKSRCEGAVDVTFLDKNGQSTVLEDGYTYLLPSPEITGVNSSSGPVSGGDEVEIIGDNFMVDGQFDKVMAGYAHTLAVANGELYAWGSNSYGQLGTDVNYGDSEPIPNPVNLSAGGMPFEGMKVTEVAVGRYHNLAIADGELFSWGWNAYGQLGSGDDISSWKVINLSAGGMPFEGMEVTSIAAGLAHSLVIANGELFSWGYNYSGQLGIYENSRTEDPVFTPISLSAVGMPLEGLVLDRVVAGGSMTFLITDGGELYTWGSNSSGGLGSGSMDAYSYSPINLSNSGGPFEGKIVMEVALGTDHALAIADGELFSWGYNYHGQLGNGDLSGGSVYSPINLSNSGGPFEGKGVTGISASNTHSLAVADGRVYAWGWNGLGELAIEPNYTPNSVPIDLGAASMPFVNMDAVMVSAGGSQSFALVDGELYAWGDNHSGQLGLGVIGGIYEPTVVEVALSMVPFVATIEFGTVAVSEFVVEETTMIRAITPQAPIDGLVDVKLTALNGQTAVLRNGYEYLAQRFVTLTANTDSTYINITPSSSAETFSDVLVLTADTNYEGGYVLSAEQGSDGTDLTCGLAKLPITGGEESPVLDVNSWGIGVGTAGSLPSIWRNVSGVPDEIGGSVSSGIFETYVYFGARADLRQPACLSYTGSITFTAKARE